MQATAAILRELDHQPPFAGALEVVPVELAPPGPDEVLLRIAAAGVCHSDLSVINGDRPRPVPLVVGHEAAGVVEGVGSGVGSLQPGDHVVATFVPSCGICSTCRGGRPVMCPSAQEANSRASLVTGTRPFSEGGTPLNHHLGVSAFATYSVVSPRSLVKISPDIPLHVAAVFGCAMLTGVGAVMNTAGVTAGASVAVFGLGGVGLAAVMGAVVAEAATVVGIDVVADKLTLASELGATATINASSTDPVDALRELSEGGVDWAFETAGSAAVLQQCYAALSPGGTAVSVGIPHPDADFTIKALSLVAEEKGIRGSYMGSSVPGTDIPRLVELYRQGRLPADKLITRRGLALDDLNDAIAALAGGTQVRQIVEPA